MFIVICNGNKWYRKHMYDRNKDKIQWLSNFLLPSVYYVMLLKGVLDNFSLIPQFFFSKIF